VEGLLALPFWSIERTLKEYATAFSRSGSPFSKLPEMLMLSISLFPRSMRNAFCI
jgi:hypothetical protein